MKTRTIFIILGLIMNSQFFFAQSFNNSYRNTLSGKPTFNKLTGEIITEKDLGNFIKKYPNSVFEPVIDKYGNIESFQVDPSKPDRRMTRDISKRVKNGEQFPEFVMKSMKNNILDSEKLKGNAILIRFQLFFNESFFNETEFNEFENLVDELKRTMDFSSIIVTESSENEVRNKIDINKCISEIIPDGRNFNARYLVTHFPSYIIIDKYGALISYYETNDLLQLKMDLYGQK